MAKKKLLFYINQIAEGGAERVMTRLANSFSEDGYDVIFITSFLLPNEYYLNSNVKRLSVEKQEIVQSKIKRNYSRVKYLRRVIKKEKPDAVISFMMEPNFRILLGTIGLGTKKIISVRNVPEKEYAGKIGWIVSHVLFRLADGVVFQTEDAKKWFPKSIQKKSEIIFNAVDPCFFNTEKLDDIGGIVTMGRLSSQKNQKLLIDAFEKIANEYKEITLHIYGEGSERKKLQNQIEQKKLTGRVILEGQVTNVSEILQHAKIFILSSDYEGIPNALIEAMAVGVPCISTDCPCGGPSMLIDNGINGILVNVGDIEAMTEAMRKLIANPQFLKSIGKQARLDMKSYTPDKIYLTWKNYINKHIDGEENENNDCCE